MNVALSLWRTETSVLNLLRPYRVKTLRKIVIDTGTILYLGPSWSDILNNVFQEC